MNLVLIVSKNESKRVTIEHLVIEDLGLQVTYKVEGYDANFQAQGKLPSDVYIQIVKQVNNLL